MRRQIWSIFFYLFFFLLKAASFSVFKNSVLVILSATDGVLRNFTVSPCPQGPAPSSVAAGTRHLFQRLQPSALWLSLSLCPVHFRVRGLIRLVRKGMESHLSCQIQLCAPLASKSREIFHFPLFSVGLCVCVFFTPLLLSTACHPSPHVYPILSSLLLLPPPRSFSFLFCSPWVWLKVTVHTGSLSQRKTRRASQGEKDEGNSENRRRGRGAAGRTGCPQRSALITFCFGHDWGSLEGRVGLETVPDC